MLEESEASHSPGQLVKLPEVRIPEPPGPSPLPPGIYALAIRAWELGKTRDGDRYLDLELEVTQVPHKKRVLKYQKAWERVFPNAPQLVSVLDLAQALTGIRPKNFDQALEAVEQARKEETEFKGRVSWRGFDKAKKSAGCRSTRQATLWGAKRFDKLDENGRPYAVGTLGDRIYPVPTLTKCRPKRTTNKKETMR